MSSFAPGRRVRPFVALALLVGGLLLGLIADARHRSDVGRGGNGPESAREAVRMIGFPDLALSSSARWLRAPSQAERTAPLTDAPLSFDTDPAGGVIGPP